MEKYWAIQCQCGECGNLWLSRAECPAKGYVTWPALGVYDYQYDTTNRVTFRSREIAEKLIDLLLFSEGKEGLKAVEVEVPYGHTYGRLEGR